MAVIDGGGSIATHVTDWYRTFSLFGKVGINGRRLRGLMYCRQTKVWDAGKSLTFYDYATQKDIFKLKLRGD